MAAVARLGDICSGHECWPPRPNVRGSGDVMVNGLPAHRRTDEWAVHCCPPNVACHASVLAEGSGTVFVNGLALGRVGDPVECGSSVATGSPNVFAG